MLETAGTFKSLVTNFADCVRQQICPLTNPVPATQSELPASAAIDFAFQTCGRKPEAFLAWP
jgi:hypothetical protein